MAANPIPVVPSGRSPKPVRRQVISPELSKTPARSLPRRKPAKPRMAEFHTLKRIDNTRLVRHLEPARIRDLARTVMLCGAMLGFFLLWGYQRYRSIELSFQLEEVKAQQAQAAALNTELRLEVAGLRNPSRIDVIARRQLGLTEPLPNQLELESGPNGAEVAAVRMARPSGAQ